MRLSLFPSVMKTLLHAALALGVAVGLPSCLTQRTVSEGGQTVSQGYVVKRPIKEAIENSQ